MKGAYFILLVCAIGFPSCSRHIVMHDGRHRPPDISVLIKDCRQVTIDSIDEKENYELRSFDDPVIELAPGRHVVETHFYQESPDATMQQRSLPVLTSFNALPGRLYLLQFKMLRNMYQPEIIDITEDVRSGDFRDTPALSFYGPEELKNLVKDISATRSASDPFELRKRSNPALEN